MIAPAPQVVMRAVMFGPDGIRGRTAFRRKAGSRIIRARPLPATINRQCKARELLAAADVQSAK